jgi:hypothetical protein
VSGTVKRKLLVIRKRANPPCCKGINMDSSSVLYYTNNNSWITCETLEKWLIGWAVELQRKLSKILVVLANSTAHLHLDPLKNIQLEFLSPNTTSLV